MNEQKILTPELETRVHQAVENFNWSQMATRSPARMSFGR